MQKFIYSVIQSIGSCKLIAYCTEFLFLTHLIINTLKRKSEISVKDCLRKGWLYFVFSKLQEKLTAVNLFESFLLNFVLFSIMPNLLWIQSRSLIQTKFIGWWCQNDIKVNELVLVNKQNNKKKIGKSEGSLLITLILFDHWFKPRSQMTRFEILHPFPNR